MDQLRRVTVVIVMLIAFTGSARAQSAILDDPFDVDITGTFEFEIGCSIQYGVEGGWGYAYLYLTVEGESQWSEYWETYDIQSRYISRKVVARPYDRNVTCEVSGSLGYAPASGVINAGCNNTVRDTIAEEYWTYGVSQKEFCGDIKHFPGSYWYALHYNWSTLNDGWTGGGNPHTNYGLIRSALVNGLEDTISTYGTIPYVSSGYRCPHGNAAVGGVSQSPHMKGRAADLYNNSCKCWNQTQFNVLRAAVLEAGASSSQTLFWNSYSDRHLHAVW